MKMRTVRCIGIYSAAAALCVVALYAGLASDLGYITKDRASRLTLREELLGAYACQQYMTNAAGEHVRDGTYRRYLDDGTLLEKGQYVQGKKVGSWVRYFSDGKVNEVVEYRNDMRSGWYTRYGTSGHDVTMLRYENDTLHGPVITYDAESGVLLQYGSYVMGVRHGLSMDWYRTGQPRVESMYFEGVVQGRIRQWYPGGNLRKEHSYVDGVPHGIERSWNESGQLIGECEWYHGVKIR